MMYVSPTAVVWQLMRAYTLSVLQKLAGSAKPIEDKEIIEWANKTVCQFMVHCNS